MSVVERLRADLSPPILCLAAFYLSYVLFFAVNDASHDVGAVEGLYAVGFWFILSWWLWHDSRRRRFTLPMSYGFLILLAAPVYAPIYIFQTRGWQGFLTIGLYCLIFIVITLIYIAIYGLLHR